MSASDARLERLIAPVADGMARMREILVRQVAERSHAVADMTGHVGRFRGKQLRGALVLLAGDATGNSTDEHPAIAAIVEMIHLATLVHDDVLDGADVRRRVATVHQRWDNQVAVLLGDFLYARAFALSTDLSSRLASRALAEATRRICVGEIEQSTLRYDFELTDERCESIAGAKTATLYAAACELGARYPGGREEIGQELWQYGLEIGLAFQIVDDCLDVVGEESVVGKSVGNDVEDGKVTLPVLHAYRAADAATQARIREIYTQPGLAHRVQLLRSACDLLGGVESAMARAQQLTVRARARVAALPDSPARSALEDLSEYVLERRW
ncbi:MAG: polyprenyl synthetase family protein [Planctomycetota bacterium]|nr:polyprenyl synthetase family protein [Planctomycetota bacterium]